MATMIDMGDGNIRHIHANKIRRFVAHISGCAVLMTPILSLLV